MRQHNSEAILRRVSEKPPFFSLTRKMFAYRKKIKEISEEKNIFFRKKVVNKSKNSQRNAS